VTDTGAAVADCVAVTEQEDCAAVADCVG
jgi:hypothetical protein